MYRKYVYRGVTWYDFRDIHVDEAVEVCSLYGLEDRVIKLMLNVSVRHEVEKFNNCIVVSVMVPCSIETNITKRVEKKPAHFILGEDFLITVRFDDIRGFKDIKKELEHNSQESIATIAIFAKLLNKVYEYLYHDLSERLPTIASCHNKYAYKKYLIDYSRMVKKHEQVLETFRAIAMEFFTEPGSDDTLKEIINQYKEIEKNLDQQRYVHVDCLHDHADVEQSKSYWRRFMSKFVVGK